MSEAPRAIDPSFVERLEHLRFAVDGVVDGAYTGLHKSRRRGGGLVFAEHRAYRPGDDPRTIDWRAFARSDHHRVKRFEHEAQLRAVLALDISGSMAYGGPALVATKVGFAATLLGATAEVLLRQGDAAGVALFHSELSRFLPARGGHAHARAVLEVLATAPIAGSRTDLSVTFDELGERAGRQGAVVIASDFLDLRDDALRGLHRLTARGHRVHVLHVLHQDELSLPFSEPLRFTGTEGELPIEADPRLLREAYLRELNAFRARIKNVCAAAGARYVLASLERPLHEILREALAPDEGKLMGLGLPFALLGILGIGIPLWIHRVRKRTLRDFSLPTIALLERAVQKRRRSLTFRDRPLLYARIALAALFALALARPYLSRVASYATERPLSLLILLDDSMSMQRDTRRGTLFEQARGRAERVLSELAPDSEVTIVLAGHEPRTLVARSTDLALAKNALSQLELRGARGTDLQLALGSGLRELMPSRLSAKEVLVLSDCAAHAGADLLETPNAHMRVECFEGKDARGNPYIAGMTLSQGRELDDPATLTVVLGGENAHKEIDVVAQLDGKRVESGTATIEDGSGVIEFKLDEKELRRGRVLDARIDTPNALALDDVRELSLDDVAALSVLLVDGDPAPNQLDDELRFIALALNLDDGAHGTPRVTRIDADGLAAIDLASFDVVVLANVRAPSEAEAERLTKHVARGGGLLIAAGENLDAFGYRGRMSKLLPALPRSSAPVEPALGIARFDGAASELMPSAGAGLDTARTSKRLLLENPEAGSRTLLSLSDGTPLLVAGTHGRGRVALLATTLDDDWSDLPLTPGFLPLIQGLVRGLSAVDALPRGPHPAGTVLSARVPLGARALYLLTPDGRRVDLDVTKPTVRIDDTAVPGVYRTLGALDARSERELSQLSFTIVPDTRDSDLTVRRPKPERERPAEAGAGRPRGVESWFWLMFGLLVLAEGFVRLRAARNIAASANPQAQPG